MRRREYLKLLPALSLARPSMRAAVPPATRFRSAICAYSFRNQLKDKSMSYADVNRMAADLGADGVDLTTYWLADTSDDTLFALKKIAYHMRIALYTIGIRAQMAQATADLRAAEVATVRQWLDAAQRLGGPTCAFSAGRFRKARPRIRRSRRPRKQ